MCIIKCFIDPLVYDQVSIKIMACSFTMESIACGYHTYKSVWKNHVHGEELSCARDIGNSHDPMAVAITKEVDGDIEAVGHM